MCVCVFACLFRANTRRRKGQFSRFFWLRLYSRDLTTKILKYIDKQTSQFSSLRNLIFKKIFLSDHPFSIRSSRRILEAGLRLPDSLSERYPPFLSQLRGQDGSKHTAGGFQLEPDPGRCPGTARPNGDGVFSSAPVIYPFPTISHVVLTFYFF